MHDSHPLIHFIHIPKAAGNSVMALLMHQYGQEGVLSTRWGPRSRIAPQRAIGVHVGWRLNPEDEWVPEHLRQAAERFARLPAERRAQVRAIRGFHIEYGLHEHLHRPLAYFSVLREPVDRVLSHYFYTFKAEDRPREVDLYEHIRAHIEPNLQTRLLSGPHGDGPLPPADEMLARARGNLRDCAAIGLSERFDESALLLGKAFGWRLPLYALMNRNRKRPSSHAVSDELRERLRADNALDAALYAEACELFEAQIQAYGPTLAVDLRHFRARNTWWRRWHTLRQASWWARMFFDQRLFLPAYSGLAERGWLRSLVPAAWRPRVTSEVRAGQVYFDLLMGQRRVGFYDVDQRRWTIKRPFHLFVDVRALPPSSSATL